jgi:4-hydroxybenzoate polyprenyltransferase
VTLPAPSGNANRGRFLRSASEWVGSTHPVPSFVVASLTTVFAWSVGLSWWEVLVVFTAMLANQTGIGLGNDWFDSARDRAVGRTDKPIASGRIALAHALTVAIGLGVAALALSALLGVWALVCQVVMLTAGWWYNLHAKGHWSSPVTYLVGFGLLPVFPLVASSPPEVPSWWIVVVAALLGMSAHFANALPDLHEDATLGLQGLPHRLGARASGLVLSGGIILATVLIAIVPPALPLWLRIATSTLALSGGLLATALAFRPTPPRVIFPLVMATAVVCVAAIVISLRTS